MHSINPNKYLKPSSTAKNEYEVSNETKAAHHGPRRVSTQDLRVFAKPCNTGFTPDWEAATAWYEGGRSSMAIGE